MTGVQIVGIAVISLVVIFLVAEYFMANFMATYILTPPSKLCPTPEQIRHRISQTGRVLFAGVALSELLMNLS